jgi:hypothetical protein
MIRDNASGYLRQEKSLIEKVRFSALLILNVSEKLMETEFEVKMMQNFTLSH